MREDPEGLQQQIEVLQERVSRLSAAVLRVSDSLDLDTVLREVVDSARALTGARYGMIATVDHTGGVAEFVASGFTPDEDREIAAWPDSPRLFAHFRDLAAPLRLVNLQAYVRSLGLSSDLIWSSAMLIAPMKYRGVDVGSFFLAEKEGGQEFTSADEEVLLLFASQAATAIANARAHREERRARADLEALIETSPVGVVVFDAATGKPVSSNREAQRIVEGLSSPGRAAEELLKVMTCRRADGREVSLAEFPLARQLTDGETVRAEEMTLSVPDGRSVTTLVNVTPIQTAENAVGSVVVTMQDLAPFEELERIRTEFLAIVSHELRAPLTSIKGSTATVLGASPGFATPEMLQFFRIIDAQADQMSGLIGDLLDAGRIATGTLSVSTESSDVGTLVDQARNTFLHGGARHTVHVDLPTELPRVSVDRQRIVQVLNNLFANAARHSPESSPIRVSARQEDAHVAVTVSDNGSGIPPERLPHLFRKWAGPRDTKQDLEGGLGLAICKGLVEAHGGRIWAESGGEGQGARFTFTVPLAERADDNPRAAGLARGRAGPPPRGAEVRILVVDDDPQALRQVRDALTAEGYAAVVTGDHRELSHVIQAEKPHLVLLDLMLSGTDGIELMEGVPELADLPVIFISAYGRDETIARALGTGAADYIVKPFSPTELTARVRAALRRHAEPERFVLGQLAIDYERRRVTLAGRPVELTATEYEVLRVLSGNAGRVSSYRSLFRRAPGGGLRTTAPRSSSTPSPRGSGESWARTGPAPPTSETSAASATACPNRATTEPTPRTPADEQCAYLESTCPARSSTSCDPPPQEPATVAVTT
ncbi:MAG: ATP-binding protein [Gemmatimonadetes bacterium]|nr:ATP-binding protein [Gemmatimonadota bacterium]